MKLKHFFFVFVCIVLFMLALWSVGIVALVGVLRMIGVDI